MLLASWQKLVVVLLAPLIRRSLRVVVSEIRTLFMISEFLHRQDI